MAIVYWLRRALCRLIDAYQYILSPIIGRQCRFHPTCSEYMRNAIMKHGILKGVFLGSRRISCCQPYYKGTYQDLVPETFEWKQLFRYKQASRKKISSEKDNCKNLCADKHLEK